MFKRNIMKRLLFASMICLAACNASTDVFRVDMMPSSTGRSGEVLIVMSDSHWSSFPGDTLFHWLSQPYPGLPQAEATCNIARVKPHMFNNMMNKARNIIYCDIKKGNGPSTFAIEKNRFASPQIYMKITAEDDSSFLKAFKKTANFMLDTIVYAECQRYLDRYKQNRNINAELELSKSLNVQMVVPSVFTLDVNKPGFAWLSCETQQTSQGLLVFVYPYEGPKAFDINYMINKTDSVLARNVPGPAKDSYMTLEKSLLPYKTELSINGDYVCQLRGLWNVEGDFMGGPFVSRTMVDVSKNQAVTVFGYVYGGKNGKRDLIWKIESILSSFQIKK